MDSADADPAIRPEAQHPSQEAENIFLKVTRDPVWQFGGCATGLIIGVLGLAITIYVFLQTRPVKQLDVIRGNAASLFIVSSDVASDIEVSYQGRPVEGLGFADIRIINSGNQPITEGDFSVPIAITFDSAYEIVEARITASEPDDVGMEFTVREGHIAEAEPVLLNAGDFVEARFILLSEQPVQEVDVDVQGRIVGVKQIRYLTATQAQSRVPPWLLVLIITVASVAINLLTPFVQSTLKEFYNFLQRALRRG